MGRKRKLPKKLVVPTAPMVEEPLKIYHTIEPFYLDHLRSLCAHAETPTSLVEGKSLDEHACYVRHRISEKGKLLWGQIQLCNAMLGIYVKYMSLLVVLKTLSVGETDPRTPMGLADRAPFGSAGGGDRTKSRSRRSTRAVYPASELSGEIILLLLLV